MTITGSMLVRADKTKGLVIFFVFAKLTAGWGKAISCHHLILLFNVETGTKLIKILDFDHHDK